MEAVLFDVDGTLCDSDPLHYYAFREMLQEVSSILYALKGKENREKSSSLFIDLNLQKRKKKRKNRLQQRAPTVWCNKVLRSVIGEAVTDADMICRLVTMVGFQLMRSFSLKMLPASIMMILPEHCSLMISKEV